MDINDLQRLRDMPAQPSSFSNALAAKSINAAVQHHSFVRVRTIGAAAAAVGVVAIAVTLTVDIVAFWRCFVIA
ncbi:hypothetical protein [Brooklawnia cerclae]|uniref:Uncharacterized protein n=1 Tax=Brooklawnia cerclae TaxID=349934 RepID=A0ABX0SFI1_9ACTN|nr:hypothetical protein [Brooklawnia cerclae]NIH55376.1 hypothetical protein [Brooklawnia cerclae]